MISYIVLSIESQTQIINSMGFKAELTIDNNVYPLLFCHYEVSQTADHTGRPNPYITAGIIDIRLPMTRDDLLVDWVLQPSLMKKGTITIYRYDMSAVETTIHFYNAYGLHYHLEFDAESAQTAYIDFRIGAGELHLNELIHENRWNPERYEAPIAQNTTTMLTPVINTVQWVHPETQESIEQTTYNETVSLSGSIQHPEGNAFQIHIRKKDGSLIEEGREELVFSETLDSDGTFELTAIEIKEQWADFKQGEIDELIARVTHGGITKKSAPLQLTPPPKVIVDFRPGKKYNGEYGFDYMRDKKTKDDLLTYKDILGTNKSINGVNKFTKYTTDTKYNDLKDNHYKTITFPWHKDSKGKEIEYIQSWLTVYPKQTVTLSLQVDTIENLNEVTMCLEYDTDLFTLSTDTIPAQGKKNTKKRLKDFLTLECKKEFDTDQIIKVTYGNRQLGQLNILANAKAKRKKAQVVFVKVTTEIVAGNDLTGNTTNKTGKSEKEMLERFLKQAYTKLELKEVEFDMTILDSNTKKPKYSNFNKDYTLLDTVTNPISPPKILNKYHNTQGGDNLAAYMEDIFNREKPEYKDYFKVFFFGDRGGRKIYKITKDTRGRRIVTDTGKIKELAGYAKDFNTQSAIMFTRKRKATVTHELLHCMGLHHSFDNSATYEYEMKATQNIMDYATTRKHIWLWQWKKLWTNNDLKNE
ncbi:type VI secretion system tube protein TssD [Aquimarina hainanensis]|uniref:Type VI secretion system tube protein TssD n=1 Tax=Aquimarina hainanensis TaxID=1578017 RepID=A0ABW5N9V3_9FLAO